MTLTTSNKFYLVALLGGVYLIFFIGYFSGIEFTNPAVSQLASIFLWSFFPYILFLAITWEPKNLWVKVGRNVLIVIASLFSVGATFFMLVSAVLFVDYAKDGRSVWHEETRRMTYGPGDIVFYLTNGGATTDYGLHVQQEYSLGFGLKMTNYIFSIYHLRDAKIEVLDERHIKINSLEFTSASHRYDYLDQDPRIKEGDIIELKKTLWEN